MQIQTWVVAPYKKPDRDIPDNEVFNNHVSMIRIRSEHAIGFLKGRFQSLKSLRVMIKDEKTHKFATYWVAACVGIHSFAMQCEAKEKAELQESDDEDFIDPFIYEGLSSDSDSDTGALPIVTRGSAGTLRLRQGKEKREQLKRRLFRAKEKRRNAREKEHENMVI